MIPKFRAWDKINNQMLEVGAIDWYLDEAKFYLDDEPFFSMKLDCLELMQSTGLFDENGEEIFEGDILTDEGSFENDSWDYATIEFDETDYMYYLCWKNEGICQSITECKNYSVAGNIYENKDLLNDEKDYVERLKTSLNELAKKSWND